MGSRSSTASGGWLAGRDDDSDEEDPEEGRANGAGKNDHVKVTGPDAKEEKRMHNLTSGPEMAKDKDSNDTQEMLKQDHVQGLGVEAPPPPFETNKKHEAESEKVEVESPIQVDEPESILQSGEDDDEVLRIPGSFDLTGPSLAQGHGTTWSDLLRRLTN
jgi:calcium/calmodulin-dependent protein kinase I